MLQCRKIGIIMPRGYSSFNTGTKQQSNFLQQLLGQLQGQSSNIGQNPLFQQGSNFLQQLLSGSPESSAAFEAPAMRQFNEQIVPGIAERFSGLGAGAQSSSAFQQALGQAGAGLSENLQALRSGLQMNALPQALGYAQQPISNLQGFGQLGLGTQTKGFMPKQQPFWQQLLAGLSGGAGQFGGQLGGGFFGKKLGLF
jgi:hypothetical protein